MIVFLKVKSLILMSTYVCETTNRYFRGTCTFPCILSFQAKQFIYLMNKCNKVADLS